MATNEELQDYLQHPVVLDTIGTLLYLGTLIKVTENGFWLADADVHDCRDGHAGREVYIAEASTDGIPINRRRVFILQSTVCSISRLDEVVLG